MPLIHPGWSTIQYIFEKCRLAWPSTGITIWFVQDLSWNSTSHESHVHDTLLCIKFPSSDSKCIYSHSNHVLLTGWRDQCDDCWCMPYILIEQVDWWVLLYFPALIIRRTMAPSPESADGPFDHRRCSRFLRGKGGGQRNSIVVEVRWWSCVVGGLEVHHICLYWPSRSQDIYRMITAPHDTVVGKYRRHRTADYASEPDMED